MRRFGMGVVIALLMGLGSLAAGAERDTPRLLMETYSVPVKAATKIEKGTLVVLDAGYAAPGRAATGLVALGRAQETVDNTGGGAGAVKVVVEPGIYRWDNSAGPDAIAQAEVGTQCYVVDADSVAKTDGVGTRSEAGSIVAVDAAGVWVLTRWEISLRGVDIASLDTRLTAEETATTDFETRVSAEETATADFETRVSAEETATTDFETRISTAEGKIARRQTRFFVPLAPANLHDAFAGGSGAIDVSANFSAVPLPGRQVQVVCSATCAAGAATVTGTDEAGAALVETLEIGNGLTTKGAKVFATVTRVQTSVDPGGGETVTLQTGPGFGLGGPVTAIHALSVDGVREATVQAITAVGLVEPTTAPDNTKVFAVQVTP